MMRYLESEEERGRSRALWEETFTEDSASFLDYYYREKAKDNEILVDEAGGEIVSMVQWNPYPLWVNGQIWDSRYLVAVATRPEYRRQKRMARLLQEGMRQLASGSMPFCWLMPAKEEIYLPFGFRYVFQKWEGELPPGTTAGDLSVAALDGGDLTAASVFLERELEERYQVFPERTGAYLGTLQKEVASEGGGLAAVLKKGERIGIFSYWPGEGRTEIRELVLDGRFLPDALRQGRSLSPEETGKAGQLSAAIRTYFRQAISAEAGDGAICAVNTGWLGEEKPAIMARILNLEAFVREICSRKPRTVVLRVRDEILTENNGVFCWELTPAGSRIHPAPEKEPELDVTIAELTEWLLGGKEREGYSEIIPFRGCFFTEIV